MKRASHKLGFIGTMAAMMGIASQKQSIDDPIMIEDPYIKDRIRQISHDDYIAKSYDKFLNSPVFEPKRSTVIKNKRRKAHNNRVKAK